MKTENHYTLLIVITAVLMQQKHIKCLYLYIDYYTVQHANVTINAVNFQFNKYLLNESLTKIFSYWCELLVYV